MGTSIEKLNYLNKLMTLIEIPAFFSLALQCANKYNLSIKPISISSTFFLYCFHSMPIVLFLKLVLKYFPPTSEFSAIVLYFGTPFVIICISTIVYITLHKLCPRFLTFITGSR